MINEKRRLWFAFVICFCSSKIDTECVFRLFRLLRNYPLLPIFDAGPKRDMSMWNQLMIEFLMRHNIFLGVVLALLFGSLLVTSYLVSLVTATLSECFCRYFFFSFVNYSMFGIRQFSIHKFICMCLNLPSPSLVTHTVHIFLIFVRFFCSGCHRINDPFVMSFSCGPN